MPPKNVKNSQLAMSQINAQNAKNQKNAPSSKKVIKKVNQVQGKGDLRSAFYNALVDPFHPNSLGCQVPDPFPFPTATFHVHQTSVIGPPSSSSITSGAVAFLPNPVFSMVDLQHAAGLTSLNVSIQTTPMTAFTGTGTNVSSCLYGAVSTSALASVYADYRVVSWGIKISNLQPELTATGRLMVAMIPIGDTIPSFLELQSASAASILTPVFGIPSSYLNTSDILELPTGFEISVGDLLHGDLEIAGMYTNANFWSFKTTVNNGFASPLIVSGDSASFTSSSGIVSNAGYKDNVRCNGGSAIVVYYEGVPNTAQNCFQVETIYHLEGTPNFSSTANNALISSVAKKTTVGSSVGVEQAMTKASNISNAIRWLEKGAQFLDRNSATIMKIGSAAAAFL